MYAYALAALDDESAKVTGFSSGDTLFAFIKGFYGLKCFPIFFTQQTSIFRKDLIHQGSALVYIDDILLMSNPKPHMLQLIKQLHDIAKGENLKLAAENSFFMRFTAA